MLDTYDVTSLIFHLGDYCFDCIVIVVVVEQIGLVQVNMRSSARAASVPPTFFHISHFNQVSPSSQQVRSELGLGSMLIFEKE